MKIFLLVFLFTVSLFAAEIDEFASYMGYYRDYNTALTQAKKEKKVIMLVLVGDYCPWCRKFERKTLQKYEIAAEVKKDFIPVIVDRNLDKSAYPAQYYAPRIPSVFFIEPKHEKQIFESLGYVKKDEYKSILDDVKAKYKGSK